MNILIIEDEKITAESLCDYIKELKPSYNITGIKNSVEDAVAFLSSTPAVDLIFSDIQLSDGISFSIFQQIQTDVPVIFCTAYDEYMMEAFSTNGIAYILKPFDITSVKAAIEKFERLTNKNNIQLRQLLEYINAPKEKNASSGILVRQKDKIIPVNLADIAIVYLDHGNVKLYTFDRQTWFAEESLEDFEKLNLPYFFRANRQVIINRKAVKEAAHHFNRKLLVHTTIPFEEQILISKEKSPLFLNWLATI
ncbi:LytR/AlgR family response regulator transcription factor [Parafilimonas sp.]|uniref:LytR/AlgR family response regulator transcription factor n=1 Tax=Parafilimonas sp. TaxID=1969739 RepID=UPI003F81A335